jgi:hypothetical protein
MVSDRTLQNHHRSTARRRGPRFLRSAPLRPGSNEVSNNSERRARFRSCSCDRSWLRRQGLLETGHAPLEVVEYGFQVDAAPDVSLVGAPCGARKRIVAGCFLSDHVRLDTTMLANRPTQTVLATTGPEVASTSGQEPIRPLRPGKRSWVATNDDGKTEGKPLERRGQA